jgi:plastocyanin
MQRAIGLNGGVLGACLLFAACSSSSKGQAPADAGIDGPPAPATASVSIETLLTVPFEVRIRAGGTVTFTNMDSVKHQLVDGNVGDAEVGTLFDSDQILAPNGFVPFSQFEVSFVEAGVVPYFCTEHPETTTGRIIVQ